MINRRLLPRLVVPFIFLIQSVQAQQAGVGIGTSSPNANAILDIVSPNNNKGVLVPRLTTAQRSSMSSSLSSSENGLLVYDSDASSFYYWSGTAWSSISVIQDLQLVGNTLRITNNGSATDIDLSPFAGSNTDSQDLTLTGTVLDISGGNTVDLAPLQDGVDDADNDPLNEIQNISIAGNTIGIDGGGTGFDLSPLAPATGQVLKWNGASWEAAPDATGVGTLPPLANAQIITNNGSNVAVNIGGAISMDNTGSVTIVPASVGSAEIADLSIVDLDISGTAAIAASKLDATVMVAGENLSLLNDDLGLQSDILANQADISTNQTDIFTNLSDISSNTTSVATNTGDIATNQTDISTNQVNITTNTTSLTTNATGIASNLASIGTNQANITSNTTSATTNTAGIASNLTSIGANQANISTNTTNITTNIADILTNQGGVSSNAANIVTNTSDIATNQTDISTNQSDIINNQVSTSANTANVATNTTDIATNQAAITTNTSSISTNSGNLAILAATGLGGNQSQNLVYAGPVGGAPSLPSFRSMVALDIPSLDVSKISTGIFSVARGGTNNSSLGSAGTVAYTDGIAYRFSAVGSAGQVLRSNGAGAPSWQAIPSQFSALNNIPKGNGTSMVGSSIYDDGAGNIGLGTASPSAGIHSVSNNGLLVVGNFGLGTIPTTATGSRMMWYPRKGALYVGRFTTASDVADANIGDYAVSLGFDGLANGQAAVSIGYNNAVTGDRSAALGNANTITSANAYAFGWLNNSGGNGSMALGYQVNASAANSLSLGSWVEGNAAGSAVIGVGVSGVQRISNGIANSLMVGFNSTLPTLFVGPSAGAGTTGNVGIGNSAPASKLDVSGTITSTGFQLTTTPGAGLVLTSDAAGSGTWQAASGATGAAGGDLAGTYPNPTIAANAIGSAEITNNTVTSLDIFDLTIVNADVNASAAIAGTKINPNFGSQNVITTGLIDINSNNTSLVPALEVSQAGTGDASMRFVRGAQFFSAGIDAGDNKFKIGNGSVVGDNTFVMDGTNIGIGTASPTGKLHLLNAANSNLIVESSGGIASLRLDAAVGDPQLNYYVSGAPQGIIGWSAASNYIYLFENGATSMVARSNNIGIGTSSPLTRLDVRGNQVVGAGIVPTASTSNNILNLQVGSNIDGATNGIAFFENTGGFGMNLGYDGAGGGADNKLAIYSNANTEVITFENGGNLGLGVTNPAQKLEVLGNVLVTGNSNVVGNSTVDGNLTVTSANELFINRISSVDNTGNFMGWDVGGGGVFRVHTGTNPVFYSEPDGRVRMGTQGNTSTARLLVQGANTGTDIGLLVRNSLGTTNFMVLNNGNVGIRRTPTTNDLEVNGTASKTASGSWLANSDRRIKTDIREIENSIELIKRIRPVKFKYTEYWKSKNPSIKDQYYYNFIAQEFQEVYPNAVQGSGEYLDGDPDEILQIDTYDAQITGLKALQELIYRVEALEKENAMLRKAEQRISQADEEFKKLNSDYMNVTADFKQLKAEVAEIKQMLALAGSK